MMPAVSDTHCNSQGFQQHEKQEELISPDECKQVPHDMVVVADLRVLFDEEGELVEILQCDARATRNGSQWIFGRVHRKLRFL